MSSVPEASPGDESAAADQNAARRIAIGTQRPGVTAPKVAPRHQYLMPPQPAVEGQAAATAPVVDAAASVPASEATAAPAAPAEKPGERPPRGEGKPRRERRGGGERKPSFTDVLPPSKRVAVPNLRAALEDDLEEDFQAALEGVAVDDLLVGSVPAKAEATLDPGVRVTGTVVSVGHDTAFVDLGGRRQGALKLVGLDEVPNVGDVLNLSVGGRNDDDGLYDVAPANRAVAVEDWSQLEAGMIVVARVTAANKGGLECEVAGLRGFMPASLVSPWRVENLEEMVGQTVETLVTEIVPAARRLVLSRRAVIERQAADARAKMLETLEVGTALDGIVRSVRDFGAFVDIGNGVEGLVHVSQLSWDRVANPSDVLQPGQKVRVIVKKVDRQTGKIALSARDLVESPWKHAAEKYHVGATVKGAVSRIAQFGAFIKLEPGVEGLVHVSELAHRHVRSVGDVVKEGEAVECRVLACDPDEQRLSLSIKALAAKPASAKPDDAAEEMPEPEAPAPVVTKKRSGPLKGGLGGQSDGARFGLTW
ncbi:MAG: 30S ribosomal protein S1 [Planctomycetia bacterium]